jgi:VirB8 protein
VLPGIRHQYQNLLDTHLPALLDVGLYHVDGQMPKTKRYNAIFTVGRVKLTEQAQLFQNPYGLCTTAYSISQEPN